MGNGLLGPFPIALRKIRFQIVDLDYFTKWVEAKPLTTIILIALQVQKFVWKNMINWFCIPKAIVMDNARSTMKNSI